jgi:hypothetical protein
LSSPQSSHGRLWLFVRLRIPNSKYEAYLLQQGELGVNFQHVEDVSDVPIGNLKNLFQ